jgi:hypothetical protein
LHVLFSHFELLSKIIYYNFIKIVQFGKIFSNFLIFDSNKVVNSTLAPFLSKLSFHETILLVLLNRIFQFLELNAVEEFLKAFLSSKILKIQNKNQKITKLP